MIGVSRPLAIVAHDAGAANLLLAWVERSELDGVRAVMQGPALRLWRAKFGDAALVSDIETALDGATALVSGTGWSSSLEHDARLLAKMQGVHSIAVIDHWVNYRMRFERDGIEILPDVVWVTDAYAVAEAKRTLPELPIEQRPDAYLRDQIAAAGLPPKNGDLLFVAEPARSDWGTGVQGEFQALDYLVARRDAVGIDPAATLRIRPHPSDSADKYSGWIAAHPGAALDTSADMAMSLRCATWVAGLNSFALVIALGAGRQAICALPPHAPPCVLPHHGVLHLRMSPG